MQAAARQLKAFMVERRLSQAELAVQAGVSQPTVSRALKSAAERRGGARARLFNYVGINEWGSRKEAAEGRQRVIAAFERIWDRSEAHADAIVKVLEALENFRPPPINQREE